MYRTIRRKDWFDPDDDSRVKADAFMRRPPKTLEDGTIDLMDSDGLSVYDSYHINVQACIEDTLSCHGVATLHVGTVRAMGLTVIRDPDDYRKILITNIPFQNPNDAAQEALLDAVADKARIATRCKWKKPNG
jgi:hypothetical protein